MTKNKSSKEGRPLMHEPDGAGGLLTIPVLHRFMHRPQAADPSRRVSLMLLRTALTATLASLALLTTAYAENLQVGIKAYQRGDYAVALRELRPLAEHGNAWAQLSLGIMYDLGQGVRKNDAKAVQWFRKAAEQGNAGAQFLLGVMYAGGEGVPEDDTEAAKWYRKAAEQGNVNAQGALGAMYDLGEGVPEDHVEAAKWYHKAAEQGFVGAQAALGAMYATGRGVSEDYVQAYAWFNIAAAQGDKNADKLKQITAERMTREERLQAQGLARRYWEAYVLPFRQ